MPIALGLSTKVLFPSHVLLHGKPAGHRHHYYLVFALPVESVAKEHFAAPDL